MEYANREMTKAFEIARQLEMIKIQLASYGKSTDFSIAVDFVAIRNNRVKRENAYYDHTNSDTDLKLATVRRQCYFCE
ncbi:hypothetical protein GJ496_011327 [Pomphorhynchus laevis]|nr:hypothetical protein GJ496_011327 [Pomphorhynchus laevis]